jgi:hypothetical protein
MMEQNENISSKTIPLARNRREVRSASTSQEKEAIGISGKTRPRTAPVERDSHHTEKDFDRRQKCMAGLMGILGLVFTLLVLSAVKPSLFQTQTAQGDLPGDGVASLFKTDTEVLQWTPPDLYPASIRDPMQRILIQAETSQPVPEQIEKKGEERQAEKKVEEKEDAVELTVKGIVYSEDNPSVIIENKILFEGEMIQGIQVVEIHRSTVKFQKNGRIWEQQVTH